MARLRGAILLLTTLLTMVACGPGPTTTYARTSRGSGHAWLPGQSIAQQIPNLLREIVEAVQKAIKELEDSLREQLCSRCPVSIGALLVAGLWALGHDGMSRR